MLLNFHTLHDGFKFHQQQNKWYPQRCLLAHLESTLERIYLHITYSYVIMDNVECSLEIGKK